MQIGPFPPPQFTVHPDGGFDGVLTVVVTVEVLFPGFGSVEEAVILAVLEMVDPAVPEFIVAVMVKVTLVL
jgi:hypothetical protein